MLSIICGEDEDLVETTFLFLVACNGNGSRAELNNLPAEHVEVERDIAGVAL